jgi:hypothetical protein
MFLNSKRISKVSLWTFLLCGSIFTAAVAFAGSSLVRSSAVALSGEGFKNDKLKNLYKAVNKSVSTKSETKYGDRVAFVCKDLGAQAFNIENISLAGAGEWTLTVSGASVYEPNKIMDLVFRSSKEDWQKVVALYNALTSRPSYTLISGFEDTWGDDKERFFSTNLSNDSAGFTLTEPNYVQDKSK